jgi:uncharacterized protein (DUF1015 family)
MADVRPFRGIRYDDRLAGPLSLNLGPTYDMISPDKQRELIARSATNVIRLELALDADEVESTDGRYDRAAAVQMSWLSSGILRRDAEPAMYVMEESFDYRGARFRRFGLLAAVRLEDYDRGIILPHEHTRPRFVEDRLELMKATRANFSPLMMLFREPPGAPVSRVLMDVVSNPPEASAMPPDMPAIRLWRITDPERTASITAAFRDTRLYIADGHHRYEAALRYRLATRFGHRARSDAPTNFRVMNLIEIGDPGLFLLGYHRVLGNMAGSELEALKTHIKSAFDLRPWPSNLPLDAEAIDSRLNRESRATLVMGVAGLGGDAGFQIAVMRRPQQTTDARESSDYARLHGEVLRTVFDEKREGQVIAHAHDPLEAVKAVANGKRQMAFVMRALTPAQFEAVVSQGKRLPPKSTLFHPKLPAGIVIQSLEGVL